MFQMISLYGSKQVLCTAFRLRPSYVITPGRFPSSLESLEMRWKLEKRISPVFTFHPLVAVSSAGNNHYTLPIMAKKKSSSPIFTIGCFFIGILVGRTTLDQNINYSLSTDLLFETRAPETQNQKQETVHEAHRTVSVVTPLVEIDPNKLHVAWLLSFPNSGTSYTMSLAASATWLSAGTNYGPESKGEFRNILNPSVRTGPYWKPTPLNNYTSRPTSGSVLTKNHCGGTCFDCRELSMYLVSKEAFLLDCLEYTKEDKRGHYTMEGVKKVVHIIRDPMNNIISRYHHMYKSVMKPEQQAKYENTEAGFRSFCRAVVDRASFEKDFVPYLPQPVWDELMKVPCHTDFVRYIRWHDHAFAITEDHGLHHHMVYYEDYERDWNTTVNNLFDFLGQPLHPGAKPRRFATGKTYRSYYTDDEKKSLKFSLEKFASRKTWSHISQYFDSEVSIV